MIHIAAIKKGLTLNELIERLQQIQQEQHDLPSSVSFCFGEAGQDYNIEGVDFDPGKGHVWLICDALNRR